MPMARSFTRRVVSKDSISSPTVTVMGGPPLSSRRMSGQLGKKEISAPVALLSTTNMLSYTYPSVSSMKMRPSSPSSPTFTDPTTPELSDGTSSPASVPSPPPSPPINHLSQFFPQRSNTVVAASSISDPMQWKPAPEPMRSLSNGTRTSRESNGSQRSAKYRSPSNFYKTSHSSVSSAANPFGRELAQVNEIAEEMGLETELAEQEYMMNKGLAKFDAEDYINIVGQFDWTFDDETTGRPRNFDCWI